MVIFHSYVSLPEGIQDKAMPDSNPFVNAKVDDLRRKAQDWRQKRQILRGGEVEQTRTPQPL
jgi:hypothetical protein